jgi:hypothetical protein
LRDIGYLTILSAPDEVVRENTADLGNAEEFEVLIIDRTDIYDGLTGRAFHDFLPASSPVCDGFDPPAFV